MRCCRPCWSDRTEIRAVAAELSNRLSSGTAEAELARNGRYEADSAADARHAGSCRAHDTGKFDPNHSALGLPPALAESLVDFKLLTAAHSAAPEYIREQNDWYHRRGYSDAYINAHNYLFGTLQPSPNETFFTSANQLERYIALMPGSRRPAWRRRSRSATWWRSSRSAGSLPERSPISSIRFGGGAEAGRIADGGADRPPTSKRSSAGR